MFWDRDLKGFGLRVYASGRKVFVVQTRGPNGPKRATLGRYGKLAPEQARKRAARVIDRIKRGAGSVSGAGGARTHGGGSGGALHAGPCGGQLPGGDAGELPLHDRGAHPARTRRTSDKRGGPVAGREVSLPAAKDAAGGERGGEDPLKDVLDGRSVGVDSAGAQPVPGGTPVQEVRRERFLTPDEYRELGRVLQEAEADGSVRPSAIAALRLLMLTGCRKNETVQLRWGRRGNRATREIRLRDTKTGPRSIPLSSAVEAVLEGIPPRRGQPVGDRGEEGRHASGQRGRGVEASSRRPGLGTFESTTCVIHGRAARWRLGRA